MKIFGRELSKAKKDYSSNGGWFQIFDFYPGAWQQDVALSRDSALAYSAVYACITLVASDIGKLPIKLMKQDGDGIWNEVDKSKYPVLVRPNSYQNRMRFMEQWVLSKLYRGNTYILKDRNKKGDVIALYPLDPSRVKTLVTPDGQVFYDLSTDNLSGIEKNITIPASEIIHDMMPALFHPLCGTPPIFACGLSALQGLNIQNNSAKFFGNMSRPSGMLSAPGSITDDVAARLKTTFETNFSGGNLGKLFVAGDGLKYEPMTINAHDAQLIDQLKWTAQEVCSCFHVPAYKLGFAEAPTYNNAEILNQIYYTDCLQALLESIELCLNEGLGLPANMGVEFDLDALLRMDTKTRYDSYKEAVGSGWMAPNEARKKEDMKPVKGGDSPLIQQQNFSLEAIAARDAREIAGPVVTPLPPAPSPNPTESKDLEIDNGKFLECLKKELDHAA